VVYRIQKVRLLMSSRSPAPLRPRRQRRVTASRAVAFDVIMSVELDDAYANLVLPARIKDANLDTADAGLATELTYGTLRMQGFYDRVIANAAARDIDTIDTPTLVILRLGVHQLLSMRVPDHAAVDESVNMAEHFASRGAVGFVNAVLRRISRRDLADWQDFVSREAVSDDDRLSIRYSHPLWIVRALRLALEGEGRGAELEALLASDNASPRVTLVSLPGFPQNEEVLHDCSVTPYSPFGYTMNSGGDPAHVTADSGGAIRVQDEGSQLAALAMISAKPVIEGEQWLDMCAGPGGKAALLAAEAQQLGAVLTANEIVPTRAGLVKQALAPFPTVVVETLDGTVIGDIQPEHYDRILLDAPCTGLGALRRRPESRWRKQPRDVGELTTLQAALLASAVKALKPGGLIAYITCSPHLAETRGIVEGALRKFPELSEIDAQAVVSSAVKNKIDLAGASLSAQLWPQRHGTDAMFISVLRKAQ
jgi:16S rRNA (cytosine967-C5)-methyltransferase